MTVSLRPYRDKDWPAVLALWIETWTLARPEIDFAARAPWLGTLFADSAARGAHIVVAEDGEGLIGFVLYEPARSWLEQIAVHPRALGTGAAQKLIRHAKQACPEGFGLDVNADNSRALAFYHGEGFELVGAGTNPLSGLPVLSLRWTPPQQAR
ncbi:GNAT family N-acetyltransferase [Rhodoblastus sp. 17X3]|uniref:GNAT family N-acetyltransferase n=1 Tax=Rhodoblastus sp. 17X3 TaxID=3047026 RepID=UPI0024B66FE3|nr:GNAT family N-acetyltransferase [Rhodoblastus sp. 17X3]MDI9848609.1 GNAT family N-acetyltransferase [Rhodoblastus sp. 17X3]